MMGRTIHKKSAVVFTALGLLAACGTGRDVILQGERLDLRAGTPIAAQDDIGESRPISLPATVSNASWTHRGGDADHLITHPALPAALSRVFSVDIGDGNSRRARITADPVVADGRVFTLDAGSTVTAVGINGAVQWSHDVTPPTDSRGEGTGGGLALGNGRLYVNTGFGDTIALDVTTGEQIWRQDLDAPGSAAPTVANGLVYVLARDGRAWAIDEDNGRVKWQLDSIPSGANLAGGSGAAVTGDIAIIPFPSGEIVGAFAQGGLRRWSTVIAGERPGRAAGAAATDIASDPVIDGARVYVGNASGRIVALNVQNGDRIWTATEGATSPVWPAAGSVFAVNDLNQLLRLDAGDGAVIWRVQLSEAGERSWLQRNVARNVHYGPILAGGRLIVASSDGVIRQFDPASGAALGDVDLPGGAASNPVVAGGVLYVVGQNGQLHAFR